MSIKVYMNLIKNGDQTLLAACDEDLLDKTLKFKNIDFKVSKDFYGKELVKAEEVIANIKNATITNLVGKNIVKLAVKYGIVHPDAIIDIAGTPHAQIIKL